MLGKLILRIGLKACLPLLALVGMLSYGVYMQGGDPRAVWRKALAGATERLTGSFRRGTSSASTALKSVPSLSSSGDDSTSVYTWKDANGLTHYSSSPPAQGESTDGQPRLVTVDNHTNVLAPPRIAPTPEPATTTSSGVSTPSPGQTSLIQLQQQLQERVGRRRAGRTPASY